ncbi:metal ABC transporter ATP-binding protein [Salinifilum aidingensis]
MTAVDTRGLTVRYGETLALDDVSLRVGDGRVCGLLGTNGSGKSTLFKALLGLVPAERGQVRLLDRPQRRARANASIAYVPQSEAVDWRFPVTVRDVVLMGRYAHMGPLRRPRRADRAAAHDALERVGLAELAARPIGQLSGGQRKRTFVARGIAQGAQLLLLDEPFAGVDRSSQATITELLHALRGEGRTVLVSTHDIAGVGELCDEAVLLYRGVLAHGPVQDVVAPDVLARAFGTPPSAPVEGP